MLLTSLLFLACSVCLLKQLRTTFPGSGTTYGELGPPPLVLNQNAPSGQSYGGISSVKNPQTCLSLCQVDKNQQDNV